MIFALFSKENKIIEQQGPVNNRTSVLLNFLSTIVASTINAKGLLYLSKESNMNKLIDHTNIHNHPHHAKKST